MFTQVTQRAQKAPHPSEIIDQVTPADGLRGAVYISGLEGAKNIALIHSKEISSVLTVGSDISDTRFPRGINHKIIHILDYPDRDIKAHFVEAIQFIEEQLLQKRNVLVHCYVGISRSVTIVIAHLMQIRKLSLNDGFNLVKNVRPLVQPNEGFLLQLYQFYQQIKEEKKQEEIKLAANKSTVPTKMLSNHRKRNRFENKSTTRIEKISTLQVQPIASRAFTEQSIKPLFNTKLSVRS